MRYPIVIEQGDKSTAFGVVVPDLPGCFSAGDTLDEAINNASEAIELHLEALLHDGANIPAPAPIEKHQGNPDYAGWLWAVVEIDLARLHSATKRYNITMPERVMAMVDVAAKQAGESRSAYLARAAVARFEGGLQKLAPDVSSVAANDDREYKQSAQARHQNARSKTRS